MASTRNKKENDNQISHYLLKELLVEQAVSAIYLAQNQKEDETVFLLTLQLDAIKSSDLSERFLRRAETLAQLTHATLLPLQDYGVDGKRPYAIMPHRSGQFLEQKLAEATAPSGSADDKVEIIANLNLVKQIAAGLSAAHPNGLIHHDLRPKNIYIDDTGKPYLLDLAVPPTPPAVSHVEETAPTELDFQSPEQQAGKALSGRSNVFSLGVLLYRLLAGHNPALPVSEWDIFEHKGLVREKPLNQVRSDLTEATYTVVQDSIWQKEWSRYETVDAQIKAIDRAIAAESAPPPPPPPVWMTFVNRIRQSNMRKVIIPAVALLLLLLLAMMFLRGRANRQRNVTATPMGTTIPQVIESEDTSNSELAEPAGQEEELLEAEETETPTATTAPTETAVILTATLVQPTATTETTATIPATTTATTTNTPEPTAAACVPSPPFGWARYSVQANDSLSSLGQATNTTVEQIIEVNCLDTILLSIGQEIWLPPLP